MKELASGLRSRWQFFKARYRSNVENPRPLSPEQRYQRAKVGFVVWLCLAILWLLSATVGGQLFAWAGVVGACFAALERFRVMRSEHREL